MLSMIDESIIMKSTNPWKDAYHVTSVSRSVDSFRREETWMGNDRKWTERRRTSQVRLKISSTMFRNWISHRFFNFQLIRTLIKANRSERDRRFHYSRRGMGSRMIKDQRNEKLPSLLFVEINRGNRFDDRHDRIIVETISFHFRGSPWKASLLSA